MATTNETERINAAISRNEMASVWQTSRRQTEKYSQQLDNTDMRAYNEKNLRARKVAKFGCIQRAAGGGSAAAQIFANGLARAA